MYVKKSKHIGFLWVKLFKAQSGPSLNRLHIDRFDGEKIAENFFQFVKRCLISILLAYLSTKD